MPTGYTSDLYDGKPQTFEEFVLGCAHAFGALITLRDEGIKAPIPEFKVDKYYVDAVKDAELVVNKYNKYSEEEWLKEYNLAMKARRIRNEEGIKKARGIRSRYEDMLLQVQNWTPPSPDHKELKEFMIEQLQESIKFDCGESYYVEPLPLFEDWVKQQRNSAKVDLKYANENLHKQTVRVEERNRWVKQLYGSLS